jgi:dihydroorotase
MMTDEWMAGRRRFQNCDDPAGEGAPAPDPLAKVNPPLRTPNDAKALLAAVKEGAFDVVATDHAPHTMQEKRDRPIDQAPFGMSGFEVALPLMLCLVRAGHLSLSDLIRLMSAAPAKLLDLAAGSLTPGMPADIVVFDPDARWTVAPGSLRTLSPNTPLLGMTVQGRVVRTFVSGRQVHTASPLEQT